jgi:hypothetical protein
MAKGKGKVIERTSTKAGDGQGGRGLAGVFTGSDLALRRLGTISP